METAFAVGDVASGNELASKRIAPHERCENQSGAKVAIAATFTSGAYVG